MTAKLSSLSRVFLAGLREFFMHKIEEAGVPRDQYGSERFREASLEELGAYFKLPAEEVHTRLERLAQEGGISCLHLDEETGTVSFSDGSGVKKCSDYRSRLKEAGFVSVTCWLTPEQAEIVKEWHRFNVQSREQGAKVVSAWQAFLREFGNDLESDRVCRRYGKLDENENIRPRHLFDDPH